MYEKIEEFMFDIIGLLVPGLMAIALFLLLPLLAIPFSEIEKLFEENNINLSNIINFYNNNKTTAIIIIIVAGYILGHAVKVFSKYPYSFFEIIFDDGINKFVRFTFKLFSKGVKKIIHFFVSKIKDNKKIHDNNSLTNEKFSISTYILKKSYRKEWDKKYKNDEEKPWYLSILNFIGGLYSFGYYIVNSIFSFKSPDYYKDNEKLIPDIVKKINKKLNTNYPETWYSLYKISNVIMEQEKIKSLSFRFLAKYNFYRSLALIFLLNFIYIIYFFKEYNDIISTSGNNIYDTLLIINSLLWFTFHEKYKRYWTLCGNEALISLFYFISKSEKKEDSKEENHDSKKEDKNEK